MKAYILTAIAAFTLGCSQSPLFNHANADESAPALKAEAGSACPLFFKSENLCAKIDWVKQPVDEEKGVFTITFFDKDSGVAKNPSLPVSVKLWMGSMGHGSSPVKVEPTKDSSGTQVTGSYTASEVYFVMGGDWEVWVQLKKGKTVVDQAKIDINI